ncbi:MAG: cell wall hydrolase [Proteobacteria bacterium]|nr:cell wall hydrolase [Pseudomonadota bacterium]
MAASELIAAAMAAFFLSHPPSALTVGAPADARCVPALRLRALDERGAAVRPSLTRMLGCAEPRPALAFALDVVREWLGGPDAMPGVEAQPRPGVTVAALADPADADPILKAARLVIAEWRERDPTVDLDRKQLVCLQRALYFEARGEGMLGQAAVAHVALNRVGTRSGRASICDVVREPGQFAPYLGGEPDGTDLAQSDDDATQLALETAAQVMAGYFPDPSRGGLYFYAPRLLKTQPAWARGLKETARIGGHRFFADPEARLARN